MHITVNHHHYWIEESGQGPVVLMLHGFTGSTNTWSEIIPYLESDYRVLRMDLPGHGQTKTSHALTMKEFCHELSIMLERLNIKRICLVGYSLGGRAALSFANYFPEKVELLVLESASPGLETEMERKKRRQSDENLAANLIQTGIKDFVEKWENIPLFESQKSLPVKKQKRIRDERMSQRKEGLASSLTGMGTGIQPSWWQNLVELNFPVLLLAGEEDKKFVTINRRMAALLPEAELFTFSKAGHCLHVEQPENFGTIVYGFLSKHM